MYNGGGQHGWVEEGGARALLQFPGEPAPLHWRGVDASSTRWCAAAGGVASRDDPALGRARREVVTPSRPAPAGPARRFARRRPPWSAWGTPAEAPGAPAARGPAVAPAWANETRAASPGAWVPPAAGRADPGRTGHCAGFGAGPRAGVATGPRATRRAGPGRAGTSCARGARCGVRDGGLRLVAADGPVRIGHVLEFACATP